MRKSYLRSLGLLASLVACATAQAAVVFTDNFNSTSYPAGGTPAEFQAKGWTNLVIGSGLGTGTTQQQGGPVVPTMWGNGCSLEYLYMVKPVSCGDIISIDANCMRFEGYSYLEEIGFWDGADPGSYVAVATFSGIGHAQGTYATWWTPPVPAPLATLSYSATPADAGKYLIFRYGHGNSWSETADVTFSITPVTTPSLTVQPKDLVRTVGESASFVVGSLGCGLTYQWLKNGTNLPGANAETLTLNSVSQADAGTYGCLVANGNGSTNSQTVSLAIQPKVAGSASTSLGINFGDQAPWNPSVTVPAFGLHQSRWQDTPPGSEAGPINVSAQLFLLGAGQVSVDYSAKNTYSLATSLPTAGGEAQVTYGYLDDGGSGYYVNISGLTTSVGYANYVVRLIAATDQANNTNFMDVTLTDSGTGASQAIAYPPSTAIAGGTMALSASSTALTADSIMLMAPVGIGANQTRSTLAGIMITDKPVIAKQPQAPAGNVFSGGAFSLSADAFGVPPLAYQWQKNGTNLAGATTFSYARAGAVPADSGVYSLIVTNAYGTVSSLSSTVTVVSYFAPIIVQQPEARLGYVGGSVTFTVVADGGQLNYQWKKGAVPIANATNATLMLTGLTAGDVADYSVTVNNPTLTPTNSVAAHLTVAAIPTTGYVGAVLSDSPVAYWRLGESSGSKTAFDAYGGHDATYSGSMTLGVAGAITGDANTADNFTGGKAEVPYTSALNNPAGPFSVEFWAKPSDTGLLTPIASQDRTTGRAGFCFYQNNGGSSWYLDLGIPTSTSVNRFSGTTPATVGVWAYLVFTYDGTNGALYVNGNVESTGTVPYGTGFLPNTLAPFEIGIRNGNGLAYNGLVDDVAYYGQALTRTQVQKHYLAVNPMRIAMTPATGIVLNAKPDAAPVHGQNSGATWLATQSDGATTRSGVMQFDATVGNQIAVNGYAQLDSTNGTLCFWVRSAASAGSGSEAAMLLDRRDTGGGGSGTIIALKDDGTLFFQANPTGANPFSSAHTVNDGLWHHVAVTYGQNVGDNVTIYVDGIFSAQSGNAKAWWWPSATSLLLGKSRDTYWKMLNGSFDDVRSYNRILTDVEIAQVITGAVVDATALTLRLNFDAAPVSGYRLTTTPITGTIQNSGTVGSGYSDLGLSPCLYVPTGALKFFRAHVQ